MNTYRRTATIVGVLYIVGTVAGILSGAFTQSTLSDPDYLSKVSANESQIVIGTLFLLTMSLALAMVPVMLFPILKKQNEILAIGYVVFRGALEAVVGIIMAISQLLLILVSQQYAADVHNASHFQNLGAFVLKGNDSINPVLIITFSLGALILYTMFYQSRLIPRWISVWGFAAILLHFSTAFLILFHVVRSDDMSTLLTFNFPIFLQEMVMAVWLIAKGFNSSAITAKSTSVNTNELQMSTAK
ncbi:MAG: DUF4386 domain-containing protein [Anaerolineae bacterium]|nr:DUF4386 domain-containing protein [Anaerolineae bacterium]